jgi:hypothetical protein
MEVDLLERQVKTKAAMLQKAKAQHELAQSLLEWTAARHNAGTATDGESVKAEGDVQISAADVAIAEAELAEVELRRKYAQQKVEALRGPMQGAREVSIREEMRAEMHRQKRNLGAVASAASRAGAGRSVGPEAVNTLKQIAVALHNYHSNNGRFPGPAILSAERKPLLSWRVAILPQMGLEDLYSQFKLDEPWDSEHNTRLIARIPPVYALGNPETGETRFQAVVGPETMWGKPEGVGFSEILDGTSNTVAVVMADAGVIWTKPEDLPFGGSAVLLQLFERGAPALLADGSVRNIRPSNPSLIASLFTRAGGEVIDWDRFGPATTTRVTETIPPRAEAQDVRLVSIEQLTMRRLEREAEALRAENRALMSVVEALRARDRQPLAASEQIDLAILAKLLERAGGDEESLVRTAVKLLLKREASEQEVADGLERIKAAEDRGAALEALLRAISVQQARAGGVVDRQ